MRAQCVFVVATLCSSGAHADRVRFEVRGGATLYLYNSGDHEPFAKCHGSCSLDLIPSTYRVLVPADASGYEIDERVVVAGATKVAIDPGRKGLRWGLKTLGAVSILAGAVAFVFASNSPDSHHVTTDQKIFFFGGVGLVLGGIATIGTTAAFGPSVRTWSLAPTVSREGLGTAFALRF